MIIRGIVVIGVPSTRITDVAIIHSKTSLSVIAGERYIYHPYLFCGRGVPRPYIQCVFIGLAYFLLPTFYLREAEARRAAIHDNGSSACVSQ